MLPDGTLNGVEVFWIALVMVMVVGVEYANRRHAREQDQTADLDDDTEGDFAWPTWEC